MNYTPNCLGACATLAILVVLTSAPVLCVENFMRDAHLGAHPPGVVLTSGADGELGIIDRAARDAHEAALRSLERGRVGVINRHRVLPPSPQLVDGALPVPAHAGYARTASSQPARPRHTVGSRRTQGHGRGRQGPRDAAWEDTVFLGSTLAASDHVIYVSPATNSSAGSGTSEDPFGSLSSATSAAASIVAADPGAHVTISVAAGLLKSPVKPRSTFAIIPSRTSIVGAGSGSGGTVLECATDAYSVNNALLVSQDTRDIGLSHVSVNNCGHVVVFVRSTGVTLSDVNFGESPYPLHMSNSFGVVVEDFSWKGAVLAGVKGGIAVSYTKEDPKLPPTGRDALMVTMRRGTITKISMTPGIGPAPPTLQPMYFGGSVVLDDVYFYGSVMSAHAPTSEVTLVKFRGSFAFRNVTFSNNLVNSGAVVTASTNPALQCDRVCTGVIEHSKFIDNNVDDAVVLLYSGSKITPLGGAFVHVTISDSEFSSNVGMARGALTLDTQIPKVIRTAFFKNSPAQQRITAGAPTLGVSVDIANLPFGVLPALFDSCTFDDGWTLDTKPTSTLRRTGFASVFTSLSSSPVFHNCTFVLGPFGTPVIASTGASAPFINSSRFISARGGTSGQTVAVISLEGSRPEIAYSSVDFTITESFSLATTNFHGAFLFSRGSSAPIVSHTTFLLQGSTDLPSEKWLRRGISVMEFCDRATPILIDCEVQCTACTTVATGVLPQSQASAGVPQACLDPSLVNQPAFSEHCAAIINRVAEFRRVKITGSFLSSLFIVSSQRSLRVSDVALDGVTVVPPGDVDPYQSDYPDGSFALPIFWSTLASTLTVENTVIVPAAPGTGPPIPERVLNSSRASGVEVVINDGSYLARAISGTLIFKGSTFASRSTTAAGAARLPDTLASPIMVNYSFALFSNTSMFRIGDDTRANAAEGAGPAAHPFVRCVGDSVAGGFPFLDALLEDAPCRVTAGDPVPSSISVDGVRVPRPYMWDTVASFPALGVPSCDDATGECPGQSHGLAGPGNAFAHTFYVDEEFAGVRVRVSSYAKPDASVRGARLSGAAAAAAAEPPVTEGSSRFAVIVSYVTRESQSTHIARFARGILPSDPDAGSDGTGSSSASASADPDSWWRVSNSSGVVDMDVDYHMPGFERPNTFLLTVLNLDSDLGLKASVDLAPIPVTVSPAKSEVSSSSSLWGIATTGSNIQVELVARDDFGLQQPARNFPSTRMRLARGERDSGDGGGDGGDGDGDSNSDGGGGDGDDARVRASLGPAFDHIVETKSHAFDIGGVFIFGHVPAGKWQIQLRTGGGGGGGGGGSGSGSGGVSDDDAATFVTVSSIHVIWSGWMYIVGSVVLILLAVIAAAVVHRYWRKRHSTLKEKVELQEIRLMEYEEWERAMNASEVSDLSWDVESMVELTDNDPDDPAFGVPQFKYAEIEQHLHSRNRLSRGGFGEVFRCRWNGRMVAVKKAFVDGPPSKVAKIRTAFIEEVSFLHRAQHPNILSVFGACFDPPDLCFISELMERGSLHRVLHVEAERERLHLTRRIDVAMRIAAGMSFLHTRDPPIVHRDLKSVNVLVGAHFDVKIADFGLARSMQHTHISTLHAAGTPAWMAPEMLRNEEITEKADVFSFGVVLWEIMTGLNPWQGKAFVDIVRDVGINGERLDVTKVIFDEAGDEGGGVGRDGVGRGEIPGLAPAADGAAGAASTANSTFTEDSSVGASASSSSSSSSTGISAGVSSFTATGSSNATATVFIPGNAQRAARAACARIIGACFKERPAARPSFVELAAQLQELREDLLKVTVFPDLPASEPAPGPAIAASGAREPSILDTKSIDDTLTDYDFDYDSRRPLI